jgi:signal transduction histidine kinase
MWLLVWGPIAVITAVHFGTHPDQGWIHGVLRRIYYLPIILAAFRLGLVGGISAALVTTIAYLPHAFATTHHHDPAPWLEKALEIVLYNVVGVVAGYLAGAERRRRQELQGALDEQQRLQQQLVRAGRLGALGEVVAGIAHEIKNPLHALKGSAEIIAAEIPEQGESRKMWDMHARELDRLERVAEQFLSFARPAGPELRELDLRDVARRLDELVAADARNKGIDLELRLPEDPVPVKGDRDQLAQIAINLALNGVRALESSGGGNLRVSVERRGEGGDTAALTLENDGPPLPEESLEHLFDPFVSGNDDGTGLGLSISSRIAEQHAGWLEAENAGLGVRFSLLLPTV